MTCTSWSGAIACGSKATVASPVIRFTVAALTPAARSRDRCTLPLQAAQVIPVTGMVQVALAADISKLRDISSIDKQGSKSILRNDGFIEDTLGTVRVGGRGISGQ